MPAPGEYKTVQSRILAYAQEIGWSFVPREEAERRRGFDPAGATPEERARKASLFFCDLLHSQIRAFNPKYKEAEGALVGEFQRFHADIYGNRDFLTALRNQHKYYCAEESRELDLTLIDYGDLARPPQQWRNVYEVTEEFYYHHGRYGIREDVVFLINGVPVLVIECKNATKEEGIALGIDQIRRYHVETPEVMVPQMLFTATEAIDAIKTSQEGKAVKVINLIKSIERSALDNSEDPFLVAMAERTRAVQESFEDRQSSTEDALAELLRQMERDEVRKREQAAKELDGGQFKLQCRAFGDGPRRRRLRHRA